MPVPRFAQVIPGASVSIVLKADQPTGRQVGGTVQAVLTRGDHPRGVKVRLVDGRVGRVQSLSPTPAAANDSQPDDYSPAACPVNHDLGHGSRGGADWKYRDMRYEEDELGEVQETIGLDAYIKPAQTKRGGKNGGRANQSEAAASGETSSNKTRDAAGNGSSEPTSSMASSPVIICPICGDFEGDEGAVTHHVGLHCD